jgi:hypothetical protein
MALPRDTPRRFSAVPPPGRGRNTGCAVTSAASRRAEQASPPSQHWQRAESTTYGIAPDRDPPWSARDPTSFRRDKRRGHSWLDRSMFELGVEGGQNAVVHLPDHRMVRIEHLLKICEVEATQADGGSIINRLPPVPGIREGENDGLDFSAVRGHRANDQCARARLGGGRGARPRGVAPKGPCATHSSHLQAQRLLRREESPAASPWKAAGKAGWQRHGLLSGDRSGAIAQHELLEFACRRLRQCFDSVPDLRRLERDTAFAYERSQFER